MDKPLTPEQEAMIPEFRERYFNIAMDPKRIDREELSRALADAYALIHEPAPELMVFDSPHACMIAISIYEELEYTGRGISEEELLAAVRAYVAGPKDKKNRFRGRFLWGSHEMYWIACSRFAQHIGHDLEDKTLKLLDIVERIGRQCEWYWPFKGLVIASQKPLYAKWDDQNRLHCANGPALQYADGWSMYVWHGTRVRREWIETPDDVNPTLVLTWENIEQRRALAEILGWDKVISLLDAVTIDKDPDPMVGELIEVTIPEIGAERFLRVRCPTGRDFTLAPVDSSVQTAREANAGTWRLSGIEYRPEIQT